MLPLSSLLSMVLMFVHELRLVLLVLLCVVYVLSWVWIVGVDDGFTAVVCGVAGVCDIVDDVVICCVSYGVDVGIIVYVVGVPMRGDIAVYCAIVICFVVAFAGCVIRHVCYCY